MSNSAIGTPLPPHGAPPARRRSLRRDRRGVAAVEFGVIAAALVVLLLGVFDLGTAIHNTLVLRQAIRAGALYALYYHDTPGIQQTIEASMPSSWTDASVYSSAWTPTLSCACTDTSGNVTASSGCTCSSGSTLERLMSLTVTRPYSPMLLTGITQVSASDVIRYQ